MTGERLRAALENPAFYPHSPQSVEVIETGISWVFLADDLVYKVKKPIVLPFLDYGTLERRRRLCEEEVRLNRRLAPEIYLAVRPILRVGEALALGAPGQEEEAVEFAVEMRRLPEERTLASLLDRGELDSEHLRRVGERVASFHARAEPAPEESRGSSAVSRTLAADFAELLALPDSVIEPRTLARIGRFATAFLAFRSQELTERGRQGHFRDVHGDLRLEHVIVDGAVQAFDCVEFDPALRRIDVASDLAFLVMELQERGCDRLADVLVGAYREAGGDPGGSALLSFYAGHRALVRAKLHLADAARRPDRDADREPALTRGGELLELAERLSWRSRLPLLLVICGVTASGKTHVARSLGEASGLPHFSSDVTRKRLAGLEPHQPAPDQAYTDAFTRRTYQTLGRHATGALARRGGAIVDATFRRREHRDAFSEGLSDGSEADVWFVQCTAPTSVLLKRAERRDRIGEASDATSEMVSDQQREFKPLDEVAARRHLVLRTDRPVDQVIEDIADALDARATVFECPAAGST